MIFCIISNGNYLFEVSKPISQSVNLIAIKNVLLKKENISSHIEFILHFIHGFRNKK